jgi:predicted HAD superfamily phosphohydrolase YqeG
MASFSVGYKHVHELRQLLDTTPLTSTIMELNPETLSSSGIAALALDFDGVLASHGFTVPLPQAFAWMQRCQFVFGGDRIFILSNKPTALRKKWFAENFPAVRFISDVRKKPYPDGLNKIGELSGVPLSSILMVDDRLLTGCLAALVAGARPCYIRKPFISFSHNIPAETFFMLLRTSERLIVRLCSLF